MQPAATKPACAHCGLEVPATSADDRFCCRGCRSVHELLVGEGLARYYTLDRPGAPAPEPMAEREMSWLAPLVDRAEASPGPACRLMLDVAGIRCTACVWLIEEVIHRRNAHMSAVVNPALGKVELSFSRGHAPTPELLRELERFGYRFGPDRKRARAASGSLTLRLGLCAALTVNVMLFSISFYSGLAPRDGVIFTLFSKLVLILSALVVAIGGSVFFVGAWRGLLAGVLHLDLPISVGIVLAFGASLLQSRSGQGDRAYLDTLDVFVTLMLVGRWLQERLLQRNRSLLLEDDAVERLTVRRRRGDQLEIIPVAQIAIGDELVLAPADLIPVETILLDARGAITTDWITGEADVRPVLAGAILPAGGANAGRSAISVRAREAFTDSMLPRLLRGGGSASGAEQAYRRLWARFAQIYVAVVLGLALACGAWWWHHDAARAIDVTVALLVVTCPCAIGIAGPLAYELVLAHLRRRGLFVRTGDLLDKLTRIRKVLFDKTGTLTFGDLELIETTCIERLSQSQRDAAYTMAAHSNHPASRCLAAALSSAGAQLLSDAEVNEEPGRGLALRDRPGEWRLGSGSWATGRALPGGGTVLSMYGVELAHFSFRECLRADAREAIARLDAHGCEVHLLSGDASGRVESAAAALGIPQSRVRSGLSPAEKAWRVQELDQEDTLFVGDGVNDALAFERALVAGTPAIDRPVLPSKADFFVIGDGVAAIVDAIESAKRLRAVVRRNLAVAIGYNALAVLACALGWMTPLRAAVLMPATSLSILAATAYSLSERRWRS